MIKYKFIILILLVGLLLRVYGTNYGLPHYFFNSDENEYVSAVESLVIHTVSPYKTGLPINIFYYLLLVVYYPYHFINSTHLDAGFVQVARIFSAILSATSILLIYLIGKNLFNKKVGLIAALTLAVLPIDVQIAHYIKEDVYIQFFGMFSLYFLSRLQVEKKDRYALFSVIAAVLAGSAKLNGFFFAIPIAIYLSFLDNEANLNFKNLFKINKYKANLALLIISCFIIYFISTPISFMQSDSSKKYSLSALLNPEHEITTMSSSSDGTPNIIWWPTYLFTFGTGYLITVLCLIAYLYITKKQLKTLWPYLIFTSLYIFVLLIQKQRFDRWITLVTPLLGLYLAVFISNIQNKFLYRIFTAIFIIGITYNAVIALNLSVQMSKPDSRANLVHYIVKNVPKTEIIYFQEGNDSAKFYLSSLGYHIYDYSCRDPLRKIDLDTSGPIYIVSNKTLSTVSQRFNNSDFKNYTYECEQYAERYATTIKSYGDKDLDNKFYGLDSYIGPATARYLHSPKVELIYTKAATKKFVYDYTPAFAQQYSKGLVKENKYLKAPKGVQASIWGPYIAIPKGNYKLSINYNVVGSQKVFANPYLAFGIQGKGIAKENEQIKLTSYYANNSITFSLNQSTQIQFPVIFNGVTNINFLGLKLEQL